MSPGVLASEPQSNGLPMNDVVVVGAGPAGLMLGCVPYAHLARTRKLTKARLQGQPREVWHKDHSLGRQARQDIDRESRWTAAEVDRDTTPDALGGFTAAARSQDLRHLLLGTALESLSGGEDTAKLT